MSKSFDRSFWIIAVLLTSLSIFLYFIYTNQVKLNKNYSDRAEEIEEELNNAISTLDIEFIQKPSLSEFDNKALESLEKTTLFDISEISSKLIKSIEEHNLNGTLTQDMAINSAIYLGYYFKEKEIVKISSILGQEYFEKKSKKFRDYPGNKLDSLETLMLETNETTKELQISAFKSLLEQDKKEVLEKKIRRFSGPILKKVIIDRVSQDLTNMAAIAQGEDGKIIAIKYAHQNPVAQEALLKRMAYSYEHYLTLLNNAQIAWRQSPNSISRFNSTAIRPLNRTLSFENEKYDMYEYCSRDFEQNNCSYFTDKNGNHFNDEPFSSQEARERIVFYKKTIAKYM